MRENQVHDDLNTFFSPQKHQIKYFTPVQISFLAGVMCGIMCIVYQYVVCGVVWCSIMCIMCGVLFHSIQLFAIVHLYHH